MLTPQNTHVGAPETELRILFQRRPVEWLLSHAAPQDQPVRSPPNLCRSKVTDGFAKAVVPRFFESTTCSGFSERLGPFASPAALSDAIGGLLPSSRL
jgi:hypothetical protein